MNDSPDSLLNHLVGVGIPFLIRNWTLGRSQSAYGDSATKQLNYLIYEAPRTSSGAISQRADPEPTQLWADFMSMAPDFIAYYGESCSRALLIRVRTLTCVADVGALHHNLSLVLEGYNQIEAYYNALLDPKAHLLRHIVMGYDSTQDLDHWATGNGWAIAGMIRVLRIIQLSPFANQLVNQQQNLIHWASSLVNTIWKYQQPNGSLLNYIDKQPWQTFEDASATALIAASTFRLGTLVYGVSGASSINIGAAERARQYAVGYVGDDGWVGPVVNPFDWHQKAGPGVHSPEAQAFVLMLTAAGRDFHVATAGQYS